MGDEESVLFANEAFYRAFAAGDAEAMDEVWARAEPIACLHPGWTPLLGRDLVMQSWRAILAGPPSSIRCAEARAQVLGDVAVVICYEELDEGLLAATNVFVREGRSWKMMHHHAGPTSLPSSGRPEGPAQGTVH